MYSKAHSQGVGQSRTSKLVLLPPGVEVGIGKEAQFSFTQQIPREGQLWVGTRSIRLVNISSGRKLSSDLVGNKSERYSP